MSKLVNMDGAIEVLAALCFNPDSHEEETESFDAAWDRAYIDAERLLKPHVIEGEAEREGERDVERLLDLARQHRASAEHCRQYAEWLESEEAAEVPDEEKFGSAEDSCGAP